MFTKLLRLWSLLCATLVAVVAWLLITTPSAEKIKSCLVTKNYGVQLCDKSKSYVHISQISPYLKHTILIAEDSNFYGHDGFDWDELKNSVEKNVNVMRAARGGSTITQQLAKNVFLSFDKSLVRKIREALIAYELEQILTKDQIFEKYLNVIELGPQLYGVHDAAWKYFNKPPSSLNLLESAFITYLIPNPKVHSRTFQRQSLTPYARRRILDLCYRMFRFHRISEEQYEVAKLFVDEFPWKQLTATQLAQLGGDFSLTNALPNIPTDNSVIEEPLPEQEREEDPNLNSEEDERPAPSLEGETTSPTGD